MLQHLKRTQQSYDKIVQNKTGTDKVGNTTDKAWCSN